MARGYSTLTEKEKQTLRLLLAGHDAKSMARQLGLSVHTVNERLRDSRRKLSASSSREAARLLRDAEGGTPQSLVDDGLGDAVTVPLNASPTASIAPALTRRFAVWIIGGFIMFSIAIALYALSPAANVSSAAIATTPAAAESSAAKSARAWLESGDAGDWAGTWRSTGASFRELNTLAVWENASKKVRLPLGALISRTLISDEAIPTPPRGSRMIKFRSRFANKAEAVETLTLVEEDGVWRVVGIYLE